jgi:hypothetical protein
MNRHQQSRLNRSQTEHFDIVDVVKYSLSTDVKILGSRGSVYNISVRTDRRITCNCPDSVYCKIMNIFCKHICFLYSTIGNIVFFSIHEIDDRNYTLLLEMIDAHWVHARETDVSKKYRGIVSANDEKAKLDHIFTCTSHEHARNIEDDCPVCCLPLKSETEISKCPECSNAIHKKCVEKWLRKKQTCVYCRSDIWENYYVELEEDEAYTPYFRDYVSLGR